MGKRLIQQRRGRGTSTFRSPGFRYDLKTKLPKTIDAQAGKVVRFVHSGLHSAPLAKIKYDNGEIVTIVAPEGIKIGENITTGFTEDPQKGDILELKDISEGTQIFNIESVPGDGGKMVKASGVAAKVSTKTQDFVMVKLPSGKLKKFKPSCRACVGVVAGGGRVDKPILRAGTAFYKYKAKNKIWPHVCGQSMNAVAHPFGKKSSHTKGSPRQASRNAPAGRKVGSIAPRRTGNKR